MNKLSSLSLRTADVGSVYIIRDLAHKARLPFTGQYIDSEFSPFFVTDEDKRIIKDSLGLIPDVTADITKLSRFTGNIFEPINLKRAVSTLRESSLPLAENLRFAEGFQSWQKDCIPEIQAILNQLPSLKSQPDRIHFNSRLNAVFQKVLRNDEFSFNSKDIINEMHIEHMAALKDSLANGFLFHVTLEEELKKEDFSQIKGRIPNEAIDSVESINKKVEQVMLGVERAYALNMRMVNFAIQLYCYVKMLNNSPCGR